MSSTACRLSDRTTSIDRDIAHQHQVIQMTQYPEIVVEGSDDEEDDGEEDDETTKIQIKPDTPVRPDRPAKPARMGSEASTASKKEEEEDID